VKVDRPVKTLVIGNHFVYKWIIGDVCNASRVECDATPAKFRRFSKGA
jgi:hypothetical protein